MAKKSPSFSWSTGKVKVLEKYTPDLFLSSHDAIPSCPQIVLRNLVVWKDVATVQVEILVEVEGGDDPSGVENPESPSRNADRTCPGSYLVDTAAHGNGSLWPASFQLGNQDFLDSILGSLEGVDKKWSTPGNGENSSHSIICFTVLP